MIRLLLVTLTLCMVALPAAGTNYYVSTTGDNGATGLSQAEAWLTIDNGEQTAVLAAGDTVFVMPGTYVTAASMLLTTNGTVDSPIVYTVFGSGSVIVDANDQSNDILSVEGNHTILSGFEVTNSREHGIIVLGDSCTIKDCYSHHLSKDGIRIEGINALVIGNVVSTTSDHGINLRGSGDYAMVYGNTVYGCSKNGVEAANNTSRIFNNILVMNDKGINGNEDNICAYNNLWGNLSDDYAGGSADSAGGIAADPLFVNEAGGDFSLDFGSPAINAGLPVGYSYIGVAPDMGASEYLLTGGNVYYVAIGGSNAADGLTPGTAWATLDNGDKTGVLAPGDTVYIAAGTYNMFEAITLVSSGTAANPIVYTNDGSGSVVMDPVFADVAVVFVKGYHQVLRGIDIRAGTWDGIFLTGDSCIITECFIHDVTHDGIDVGGGDDGGSYNLILRNIIYKCGEDGIENDFNSRYNRIYGNSVYQCTGTGIGVASQATTTRVFNNIVADNDIGISGPAGSICGFNDVWSNASGNYINGVTDSAGGISSDPMFVNPGAWDFRLQTGSLAENAGLDLGYSFGGTAPEMGAEEIWENALPILTAIGPQSGTEDVFLTFELSAIDTESTPALTSSSLPSGATIVDSLNGKGSFEWTPGFLQSGTYDITFYATDDSSAVDSEVVTITIDDGGNQLPSLTAIGAKGVTENANLNFAISSSDIESTPVLTTSSLPSGAGFVDNGDGTGEFDWTPTYLQSGVYDITFYATDDSSAVDSEVVTITVTDAGNQPPVLASIGAQSTTENVFLSFGVSSTDPESTPVLTTSALPSGAGFTDNGDGTGTFSWTPTYLQAGSYDITFYATDDSSAVDSEVVTVTVIEFGNWDPVLTAIGAKLTVENLGMLFSVSALDIESVPALTTSTLPTGASFVDNGDGTGDFDWTPTYLQSGSYDITFYATDDSSAVDSEVVTITVNDAGNQLPVLAAIGAQSTTEDVNLNFTVSGTDIESTPSFTTSTLPTGAGFVDNGDGTGSFDWTPTFLQSGVYDITFYATDDSSAVDSEVVSITVDDGGNQLPVLATIGNKNVNEYANLNFPVSATDIEDIPSLSTSALPTGATFIDNGDGTGTFDWTPIYDQSGNTKITFYAMDDSLAVDSEVVSITVPHGGNYLPTLTAIGDKSTTENVNLSFGVTTSDIESTPTLSTSTLPTGAGFVDNGDGTGNFSWTPTFLQSGLYSVTFYATDDSLAVDSEVVAITVDDGGNQLPALASIGAQSTTENVNLNFSIAATDTESTPTLTTSTLPSGAGFVDNGDGTGTFDWTPYYPLAGDYDITFYATDDSSAVDSEVVTITVSEATLVRLEIAPDSVYVSADSTQVFSVTGYDAIDFKADPGIITWGMTTPVGTIDAGGLFDATTVGTSRITVSSSKGFVDTSAYLEVVPGRLVAMTVTPDSVSLTTDDTRVYSLSGVDSDGNMADSGTITWDVIGDVGDISGSGLFSAHTTGTGRIAATSSIDGVTDTTRAVVVTPGVLDYLVITPDEVDLGIGDSVTFSVLGYDADSNLTDKGDITWDALGRVGEIDSDGLFIATKPGPAKVTATSSLGSLSDTTGFIDIQELLVTSIPLGVSYATPGSSMNQVMAFRVDNYYDTDKALTGVTVRDDASGPGSNSELLANIETVELYVDNDNDSLLSDADSLIASAPYTADVLDISFSALSIAADEGMTFLVGIETSLSPRDGDSLDLFLNPSTDIETSDGTVAAGSDTVNSYGYVVVDGHIAAQIGTVPTAVTEISPADSVYNVFTVDIPRNGYAADVLNIFSLVNAGTATSDDFTSLTLYKDNANNIWDNSDVEEAVGNLVYTGDRWMASGLNVALTAPTTRFFVGARLETYPTSGATFSPAIPVHGLEMASDNDGPLDAAVSSGETITIKTVENITVEAIPITPVAVNPGADTGPISAISMVNTYAAAMSVDSLRFTLYAVDPDGATVEQLGSQVDSVHLYHHVDENVEILSPSDSLVASGNIDNLSVLLNTVGLEIEGSGGLTQLTLVAYLNADNAKDGNTLNFGLNGSADVYVSTPVTIQGSFPVRNPQGFIIDAFPAEAVTVNPVAVTTLYGGQTDRLVCDLMLPGNGYASDAVQSIKLINTGTIDDSEALTSVKLWADVAGDGYSGDGATDDDIVVGEFSYIAGMWQVSGLSHAVDHSGSRFFVTVDVIQEQFEGGTLLFSLPGKGIEYASGMIGPDDSAIDDFQSYLVFPSNRITAISIPAASATISPGATANQILTFALYNGYLDEDKSLQAVTLTNTSRTVSTPAYSDYELGQVSLYFDANNSRTLDNDSLIATGYLSDGKMILNGLNTALPAESLSYFFVLADIPLHVIDGDSLALSIDGPSDFDFSESVNINGDLPLTSGSFLVIDGSVKSQYEVLPLVPRTLSPGDTSVTLLSFKPAINGDQPDILQVLEVENSLTADSDDISVMELWSDANTNDIWDDADTQLGSFTYSGGRWSVASLNIAVDETPPLLFVQADISATAQPNAAIGLRIPLEGCGYDSDNDGPIDSVLSSTGTFTISSSGLRVSTGALNSTYSVGQAVQLDFSTTNLLTTSMDGVQGEIYDITNPTALTLDSVSAGPVTLAAGQATDFSYYYTANTPGTVSWQIRSTTTTGPDSSAVIPTQSITIQDRPSDVMVTLLNSIPAAVTRGQKNVFPMSMGVAHSSSLPTSASLRLDSLKLRVEDDAGNALPADQVFSRLVLATGYTNLTILEAVPSQAAVTLVFDEPVIIAPGQEQQFTFLVDIDPDAAAESFALAIENASAIQAADENTMLAVPVDLAVTFPLKTASCRIDNPSQQMAVADLSGFDGVVNFGQENVSMLELGLRHPGLSGSSQIQLTGISLTVLDYDGDTLAPSSVLDKISLASQQNILGQITGAELSLMEPELLLSSPLTLNAGETQSLMILCSVNDESVHTGFRIAVQDSTSFIVRDLSSGSLLDVATDGIALPTGSVFPINSAWTSLKYPAQPPEVCLSSVLPTSIVGGVDALSLIELTVDYPVDAEYSSTEITDARVTVLDSEGAPLSPDRLFDRIGYRINGSAIVYQSFVELSSGATVFRFGDNGVSIDPGTSATLELVADIEADVLFEDFQLILESVNSITSRDATDTTSVSGIVSPTGCTNIFPFAAGPTEIFLPAGKPTLSPESLPVQLAFPGQENVTLFRADFQYDSENPQGDLTFGGLYPRVMKRTASGLSPVSGNIVFSAVTLIMGDDIIATDSTLAEADSVLLDVSSGYTIPRGFDDRLSIRCDVSTDAVSGNYIIMLVDSTCVDLADGNLATRIYPTIGGASFPMLSAEISLTVASLENSFTNYPNPFRPSLGEETTIGYVLAEDSRVDIEIFSITGESVKQITSDAYRAAGPHQEDTWAGINGSGRNVVPGTYYCRITARSSSGKVETFRRKVAVIR